MVTMNTILPYYEDDYVAAVIILRQLNFQLKQWSVKRTVLQQHFI